MATIQDTQEPRFYAGLFRRRGNLGWARKKSAIAPAADSERPSTSLAEWLRMAHLLLDGKTVEATGELSNSPHK